MELPVQTFLRARPPETALADLSDQFGVNAAVKDGFAIVNYDQIESRKGCEVADDCRALTLRTADWSVAARSFRRFYNAGERPDEAFDWPTAVVEEKLDGSLMVLFHDGVNWRVNTRGSFADSPMTAGGRTWAEVFWVAFSAGGLTLCDFDPRLSYSFELCSPWNQVVVYHPTPAVHLLAAFDRDTGGEITADEFMPPNARRPERHPFTSAEAARLFVDARPGRTHEGVVARDAAGRRVKVKGQNYLHYHRLKNNGAGFAVANLVPLVMAGEGDEIAAVFPEAKERVERITGRVAEERAKAESLWAAVKDIPVQKEFALAILGKTPLTAALFTARKMGGDFAAGWGQCAEGSLVRLLEPEFGAG